MAKLYITEYRELPVSGQGHRVQAGGGYGVDQTPVTFSTSTQSAAFRPETKYVRLHTDSICSIAFGSNPTATTSNARLAANQTEFFGVNGTEKVAVITNT